MNVLAYIFVIVLLSSGVSLSATHVFWYNAKQNHYRLSDCDPGPCISQKARIHQGMIVSGTWEKRTGMRDMFSLGFRQGDEEYRSAFIYSADLCRAVKGSVCSAFVRAEFDDAWALGPLCTQGFVTMRIGVADFSKSVEFYDGLIPPNATWTDTLNAFSDTIGFRAGTRSLMAEEVRTVPSVRGILAKGTRSTLDGTFLEINVTQQVNWILGHGPGHFAIVFLVAPSGKTTGRIKTFGQETCNYGIMEQSFLKMPWTRDGNTCHLVVVEEDSNRLVFANDTLGSRSSLVNFERLKQVMGVAPSPDRTSVAGDLQLFLACNAPGVFALVGIIAAVLAVAGASYYLRRKRVRDQV